MGNFDINLAPEDAEQLKTLAKDTSYSRLAGSFNQYAAGEMALGAGQGMAQGGGAVGGAFLGVGLGMGGVAAGQPPRRPRRRPGFAGGGGGGYAGPPPGAPGRCQPLSRHGRVRVVQRAQPGGRQVLHGLRAADGAAQRHCTNCGIELAPGAKFCSGCGTPTG